MHKISVIIPCYLNEPNIPETSKKLLENEKLFEGQASFEYILVDDGSKDNTYGEMKKFHERYPEKVKLIKLTRNFGSTNAVFSALKHATGDCCIVMSADLQDPPELFVKMFEWWKKGFKLVVANRIHREDPFVPKVVSALAWFLMRKYALSNLPKGGFDMSLFDREVRDVLLETEDKNSYFPYLLVWLGYEYVSVPYVRQKRKLGKSGYTLWKKILVLIDSFVAFSFAPIRAISGAGLLLGAAAFAYGSFILFAKLARAVPVDGWASIMVAMLFISAFQMIALGIIGEYVWRALDASRKRPNYIIDEVIEKK